LSAVRFLALPLTRKYEYDKFEMLAPSKFLGYVEWEIVNNIYSQMLGLVF